MNITNKEGLAMNNFGFLRFLGFFVAWKFDRRNSENPVVDFVAWKLKSSIAKFEGQSSPGITLSRILFHFHQTDLNFNTTWATWEEIPFFCSRQNSRLHIFDIYCVSIKKMICN
jgi:hypothetical protein